MSRWGPEIDAHQAHVDNWQPTSCDICARILAEARDNHNEHAGTPTRPPEGINAVEIRPGWWVHVHADDECIRAYLRYAQKMSES